MNKARRRPQSAARMKSTTSPRPSSWPNFVGTLNAFSALVTDGKKGMIKVNDTAITVPPLQEMKLADGAEVKLGCAPKPCTWASRQALPPIFPTVEDVHFLGSVIRLRVLLGDQVMSLDTFNRSTEKPPVVGGKTVISLNPADLILIQ